MAFRFQPEGTTPLINVPGSTGPMQVGGPELRVKQTFHWGSVGETQIIGGRAGRNISFDHWLYNGYATEADLVAALKIIDSYTASHGTLTEQGLTSQVFQECTWKSHELIPAPGQPAAGPLPDVGGTLDSSGPGMWWTVLRFHFRQLIDFRG